MKRFVLAIALTGLMSMTVLAGDIPTNGAPAPAPPAPTTTSSTASTSSTLLVTVILTVLGLR
ncbi:MAG TPA: hypothetical protein VN844_27660 [Pyrinomonadaceae bacterium]|jgi:hypothetical protein|nr:hypothetical protein [Pyrinomonadaceae bacterium]